MAHFGRRRTSTVRAALLRYCEGDSDDTLMLSDPESDDGASGSTALIWHCHGCPLVLTAAEEMRVLVPCGHVFCVECSRDMAKCPTRKCNKKIEKMSMPSMQEGEAMNEEEQAEKDRAECVVVVERMRKIDNELEERKKKRKRRDQGAQNRRMLKDSSLAEFTSKKQKIQDQINAVDLKLKLAKFISTIENRAQFPVIDKGNKCKGYYLKAALEASKIYREENHKIGQDQTSEEFRLNDLKKENASLKTGICEFFKGGKKDSDDAIAWAKLESSTREPSNSRSGPLTSGHSFAPTTYFSNPLQPGSSAKSVRSGLLRNPQRVKPRHTPF